VYLSPADGTMKRLPAVTVFSSYQGTVAQQEVQHLHVTVAGGDVQLTITLKMLIN